MVLVGAYERVAAKWESALREGRYQKPSRVTWEDFRTKYETEVLPGLKATTATKVSGVFNAVERILNPVRVNSITPSRLSYLVAQLRKDGLVDATISGHLAHLKAAMGYAVDWGYLPKLPELPKLHRVKRSKTMKGRPITTEEFERMLKVSLNPNLYAVTEPELLRLIVPHKSPAYSNIAIIAVTAIALA